MDINFFSFRRIIIITILIIIIIIAHLKIPFKKTTELYTKIIKHFIQKNFSILTYNKL
ncbi:hypothetical protein LSO9J_40074 [Candidatus Liberibacter solanacearum]